MAYKNEILPDLPVLMTTLSPEFSYAKHGSTSQAEVISLLDELEQPFFLTLDMSKASISLEDVIAAANTGSQGQKALFHHPKVREILFVSQNQLTKLAAKGMNTSAFGFVKIQVVNTREEALAYVRSKVE